MLLYLSPKAQKLFDHVPVTQVMVECYCYQYFVYTLKDLLKINRRRPSVLLCFSKLLFGLAINMDFSYPCNKENSIELQ